MKKLKELSNQQWAIVGVLVFFAFLAVLWVLSDGGNEDVPFVPPPVVGEYESPAGGCDGQNPHSCDWCREYGCATTIACLHCRVSTGVGEPDPTDTEATKELPSWM